jgi:hypothetical protein
MDLRRLACIASVASLAACSGGGGGSSTYTAPKTTVEKVSGTITIAQPAAGTSSKARRPAFVSPSTGHASVFVAGVFSGSTATCTATYGTGTGCTIPWTATVTVPGSYVFSVETDTGANAPPNTVLSEGSNTYALVAGSNPLAALSLNGVVKDVSYGVTSCTGANPGVCTGTLSLAGPAGNVISYAGLGTVPTTGNAPSSGNVFDNGNVTFVSGTPAAGVVSGTAYGAVPPTFATYATNTLTVVGVQPSTTGTYPFTVSCLASTSGVFGITATIVGTPSLDVTTAQLAALSPAVTYPAQTLTLQGTAPSFTCTSGIISSETGTLPVN